MTIACAKRHPGSPPRYSIQKAGSSWPGGAPKEREVCLECKRIEAQERRGRATGSPYKIIPLNWPAPRLDV